MLSNYFSRIFQFLESQWNNSFAWPDLVRYMRVALSPGRKVKADRYLDLAGLPALCCQAAGGKPAWADAVTAAWLCFYQAAHLMDSLQDQDEPEPWWAEAGPGVALNVASGLYFSAALVLENLQKDKGGGGTAADIVPEFYHSLMVMCSGQQLELTCREPKLEQYWQLAAAKSGAFFALACWAGARLASNDFDILGSLRIYGEHLGLLIQVKDDLEDFKLDTLSVKSNHAHQLKSALPVVYAREMLPDMDKHRLDEALSRLSEEAEAAARVHQLLDQSGASLYILTEIERHQQEALKALNTVPLEEEATRQLKRILEAD